MSVAGRLGLPCTNGLLLASLSVPRADTNVSASGQSIAQVRYYFFSLGVSALCAPAQLKSKIFLPRKLIYYRTLLSERRPDTSFCSHMGSNAKTYFTLRSPSKLGLVIRRVAYYRPCYSWLWPSVRLSLRHARRGQRLVHHQPRHAQHHIHRP
jgi:hypothetical protein